MALDISEVTTNFANDLINEDGVGGSLAITGDGTLELRIVFNQSMNTQPSVTPVISFPGSGAPLFNAISFDNGAWATTTILNDTYVFTFDIIDNNVDLEGIDILISNARSQIGDDLPDTTLTDVFSIDTLIPDVPATAPDLVTDTGSNTSDDLTNDDTPVVNVTLPASGLEAGDIVQLVAGGLVYAEYEITGSEGADVDITIGATVAGSATSVETALPEGMTSLTVSFLDNAGNTRDGTAALDVTVDTTPPVATITLDATIAGDDVVNIAESGGNVDITGSVGGDRTATP